MSAAGYLHHTEHAMPGGNNQRDAPDYAPGCGSATLTFALALCWCSTQELLLFWLSLAVLTRRQQLSASASW